MQTVTVNYTDLIGSQLIDFSTINTGDITISGPGGFSATPVLTGTTPSADAKTIIATYDFAPPVNGQPGWDFSDNGTYTIAMAAGVISAHGGPVGLTLCPLVNQILGVNACSHNTSFVATSVLRDLIPAVAQGVWGPIEELYPEGKVRHTTWDKGIPMEKATHKQNELIMPEGSSCRY